MSETLPISPLWVANALAYGSVLAHGIRLVPAFALAALVWNIARGDTPQDILVGTGAFLIVMLFVAGFSTWLEQHIDQDRARRLLRVPIIALFSASLFTLLGVWQFTEGAPSIELMTGLWLSEVTSVLLFTPLARQWHSQGRSLLTFRPSTHVGQMALATWIIGAVLTLIMLWLFSASEQIPQRWVPYAALCVPILAVYLLPTGLSRLLVPIFMLAWTGVHLYLFTNVPSGFDDLAMLNSQMVIFTAALIGFIAIEAVHSHEITNRQLKTARLHDGLTGLYNDLGLTARIRHHPAAEQCAMIGIQIPDVDDLATLTGVDEVHQLEQRIADTLRYCIPASEGLGARLQPGLFAVLMISKQGPTPLTLTRRLQHALHQSLQLSSARLNMRIALIDHLTPDDFRHLTSLLLISCQRTSQPDHAGFYHHQAPASELIDQHRDTLNWASRLRNALAGDTCDGQFTLFVQPILEYKHPDRHRAEILIRWQRSDGSLDQADAFLGIAETFGLMHQLDEWVLNHALAKLASHPGGQQVAMIAINLSGHSMASTHLPDIIATILAKHAWPPQQLCLEITETSNIGDTQVAQRNIEALQSLGVSLAIDDFGTGLATFDYLKHYAVEEIKIDGNFIRDIATSGLDREIVRSTCALANYLNVRVVAEFVETQAQIEILVGLGVDFLQGFGIARPIPLDDYLDRLVEGAMVTSPPE
ncbi:EAL domain-containing protein [Halomonas sp. ML-15]|uniref:EAL domain-containing protein n=1 Tax=Halomonas sp. ML-15 TaxID=2773305 RepID=UPI001745E3BC|nr:EAL domain-containing protein [Halomonas sp. ML-15]MBD3894475.1 EAL domain-containing protein [Halomonas sp. ML-15]